jgi:hypothetical protein
MKLLKNKWFLILIFFVMCAFIKIYFFDRYFISSKDNKTTITYFIDKNYVYILPYKYWGFSNPKSNYIKFDRTNYSQEMNVITFYKTERFKFILEYENGQLVENKLSNDCFYFTSKEIFKTPYLNEIKFGQNKNNIVVTSSFVRNNNPFWVLINKIF